MGRGIVTEEVGTPEHGFKGISGTGTAWQTQAVLVKLFPCPHGTLQQKKTRLPEVQERCQETYQTQLIPRFQKGRSGRFWKPELENVMKILSTLCQQIVHG